MEFLKRFGCFGGTQAIVRHSSQATGTDMEVAVFVPPQVADGPVPILYYLSGLTCTWENACSKAGAQAWAARKGLMLVFPDTSPRGEGVADDPAYDMGQGAGFYVDATQAPWAPHFQMETYITQELPALIAEHFPGDGSRAGITGHSMGGHGALTLAMRHPDLYQSVSAFAPIVAPSQVPWGHKALGGYLGEDAALWADHDTCALMVSRGWKGDMLVDQGQADPFLEEQLQPMRMIQAADESGIPLFLNLHPNYDHSYYFVASFMEKHVDWHAERLGLTASEAT